MGGTGISTDAVDVRAILDAHGSGSFAVLLMLFTIIALIPIPGVPLGFAMSIGMFAVAMGMLMGIERMRLPARLENLKFSNRIARQVLHRMAWLYLSTARYARPRLHWLAGKTAVRWLGAFVAVMAALIFLPVPFGNYVPGAALLLLALSLMFRDGVGVLISIFIGVLAVIWIVAISSGTAWAVSLVF